MCVGVDKSVAIGTWPKTYRVSTARPRCLSVRKLRQIPVSRKANNLTRTRTGVIGVALDSHEKSGDRRRYGLC